MFIETCRKCGKTFERNSQFGHTDSPICYGCALNEFTGGRAPEEGDFNSAYLTSGEISDKELKWLQEDMESVDHSREEALQSRLYEENNDDGWDDLEERDDA